MADGTRDPSPKEIRKMCEKIREDWSEREEWIRRGFVDGRPELTVPLIRNPHNRKAM
jgi:hypothetical protein